LTENKTVEIKKYPARILIYGYGNPGRQDDAVGVILAEEIGIWVEKEKIPHIDTDQNYQLNIEDADKIAHYDIIVFADASVSDINRFQLDEVIPDMKTDFTMHSVTPSFVAGLCEKVFNKKPMVYQLQIKGYEWEFMKEVSEKAKKNLYEALDFLKKFISKNRNFMSGS
jgi:hydrogenase maturation protease